jgi:hypothetical protein
MKRPAALGVTDAYLAIAAATDPAPPNDRHPTMLIRHVAGRLNNAWILRRDALTVSRTPR